MGGSLQLECSMRVCGVGFRSDVPQGFRFKVRFNRMRA